MSKYRNKDLSIQERAKIVDTERKIAKIISLSMACIFILCTIIFVISLMYSKFGGFTVEIPNWKYFEKGLSLSETRDFKNPTTSLNCRATEILTNISGKALDEEPLGAEDGNDSGKNYLCYSFYIRNSSESEEEQSVAFDYTIYINEKTMNIENAVRIRVITSLNGGETKTVDYAKISKKQDQLGQYLKEEVYCDEAFRTPSSVCDVRVDNFKSGDVMRFTVVIWLEGDDPECLDDIIGGEFKIGMKFNIVE